MIKVKLLATITIALTCALPVAHAADPAAGQKQFEASCSACHGQNGISVLPMYPNLAGQKMEYLEAQLKAFRDGTRPNPIMAPMAKGLSDIDIANLAIYLSTLKSP